MAASAVLSVALWNSTENFRSQQTWEEDAQAYVAGRNFVRAGFWRTLFMDDYAAGRDLASHPKLYTHFPTSAALAHSFLQSCGLLNLHWIKACFIPFFLLGQFYFFLCLRKLFNEKIALFGLLANAVSYLGVLSYSDSSCHYLHWLVIFGALYHYLSIPAGLALSARARFHLVFGFSCFFVSGAVTLIHALFISICLISFYLSGVHRIRFKYFALIFGAPVLLFGLHSLRVMAAIGPEVWLYEQFINIKKSAGLIDPRVVMDYYTRNGIILYTSEFDAPLNRPQAFKLMAQGFLSKEGAMGMILLAFLPVVALFQFIFPRLSLRFDVPDFGKKIVILIAAALSWDIVFQNHAANYFGATPYLLLTSLVNLGWGLLFAGLLNLGSPSSRARQWVSRLALVLALAAMLRSKLDAYNQNLPQAIPGSLALQKYAGGTFYTNIFPSYVSCFTDEWAIGGLEPKSALERNYAGAKWFFEKDQWDRNKYTQPDYYFHVSEYRFAPYAEPAHKQILDASFPLVESGEGWYIYKMR